MRFGHFLSGNVMSIVIYNQLFPFCNWCYHRMALRGHNAVVSCKGLKGLPMEAGCGCRRRFPCCHRSWLILSKLLCCAAYRWHSLDLDKLRQSGIWVLNLQYHLLSFRWLRICSMVKRLLLFVTSRCVVSHTEPTFSAFLNFI